MAKDAIVSDELAKKFATEKDTPYLRWVRAEGLDIIGAHYVRNLRTVELKPWPRRGGSGVYINHEASRTSNDCYVCAIPLNCWHQHFNGSGAAPARYVAVTNAPPVINLYEDTDFVFNTAHDFKSRFNGEPDYFSAKGEQKGLLLVTNFVADAVNMPT